MKRNGLLHLKTMLTGVQLTNREACHLEVEFRGYQRMQILEQKTKKLLDFAVEEFQGEPMDVVLYALRQLVKRLQAHNAAFHYRKAQEAKGTK